MISTTETATLQNSKYFHVLLPKPQNMASPFEEKNLQVSLTINLEQDNVKIKNHMQSILISCIWFCPHLKAKCVAHKNSLL